MSGMAKNNDGNDQEELDDNISYDDITNDYQQDDDQDSDLSYDNDNDSTNNDDDEGSEDTDDEEDEEADDDGVLSYLLDKSLFKQHSIAILVALIASSISYFHLGTHHDLGSQSQVPPTVPRNYPKPAPSYSMPSPNAELHNTETSSSASISENMKLKPTRVHHHHSYRRTNNLNFCPMDGFFSQSESNSARISRALYSDDNDGDVAIDSNLRLFEFNFPKEYLPLMKEYYHADDVMDDNYNQLLNANEQDSDKVNNNYGGKKSNTAKACMEESMVQHSRKSTIPMNTVAYVHPSIDTFYKDSEEKEDVITTTGQISVKKILNEKEQNEDNQGGKKKIKPVSLTYTGFNAKFINLSNKPLNLFWNAGSNKIKHIAKVQPFESFTTVTTPGNSFFFAPTYDKEHALARYTMTADEAVVYYDPISNTEDSFVSSHDVLTQDEKRRYKMQTLNLAYGREYLAMTQRAWFSTFPRPMPMHYMWDAEYLNQVWTVRTKQTHFVNLPLTDEKDKVSKTNFWKQLDYKDYENMVEEHSGNDSENDAVVTFSQYRAQEYGAVLDLKLKVVSVAPRVFEINDFLSQVEVDHLLEMAQVYNVTTESSSKSNKSGGGGGTRSSSSSSSDNDKTRSKTTPKKKDITKSTTNAWIRREFSPVVDTIYRRAADVLQIDESFLRHRNEHEHTELNTHHSIAEAIHMVHHVEGQEYPARHDCRQSSISNRYQPDRFATILLFLSDDESMKGGDTVFPKAINTDHHDGIRVKSKAGRALLFYNTLPDGNWDELAQHAGELVEEGEKWMGTLWIWDPIID